MSRKGLLSWWRPFRAWARERERSERRAFWLSAALVVVMAGGLGVALGYGMEKALIPYRLKAQVSALLKRSKGPPVEAPIEWSQKQTLYHVLDVARLPLGRAWSLADVDGHIVYASRLGRLGYVTPDNRAMDLGLDAPIGLERLRKSSFATNEFFEILSFRITDLLSVETAPHRFDLYVAHLRFEGDCFRMVVSRVRLTATEKALRPDSHAWDQIYQSRDCVHPKSKGSFFAGDQSGGRLVRLDQDRLALSIGDFQFDGVNSDRSYAMDPNSDLGKIIEISLSTGKARVLASGLRNPQGLLTSRSGELWETEHGPQGGDEVNKIIPGANYGWPIVTYGMRYGSRPINWPANPSIGNHDGYERPKFAFLPSVGISNLTEPDPREFPAWGHHLLVASLKRNMLYLLRLEGDVVIYAEPMLFEGQRIRDIISLRDGRIAFATDQGDIFLLSNADFTGRHPQGRLLTGLGALRPRIPEEALGPSSPARWGALAFGLHCSQCHSATGDTRIGPPLDGVIGRRVGGVEGYAYSAAMTGRSERWTDRRLRQFLLNVEATYPGTAMAQPHVDGDDLENIIRFLAARKARTPQGGVGEHKDAGKAGGAPPREGKAD